MFANRHFSMKVSLFFKVLVFVLAYTSLNAQKIELLFSKANDLIEQRQFEDAKLTLHELANFTLEQNKTGWHIYALSYLAYCELELANYLSMNRLAQNAQNVYENWETPFPVILPSLHYVLGVSYLKLGNSPLALEYLNSSYVYKKQYNDFSFRYEDLLNNLALCYFDLSDYERARLYAQLAIQSENPDIIKADIAQWNNLIAKTYLEQNNYSKAQEYFNAAIADLDQIIDLDRKYYSQVILNNYTSFLIESGDYEKAKVFIDKLNDIGPNKANLVNYKHNIANLSLSQKKYQKALSEFNEVISLGKDIYGENHIDMIETYSDIGVSYLGIDKYEEAINYFNLALNANRKVSDASSLAIDSLMYNDFLIPKEALNSLVLKATSIAPVDFNESKKAIGTIIDLLAEIIEKDISTYESKLSQAQFVRRYIKDLIDLALVYDDVGLAFSLCQLSHGLILDLQMDENTVKSEVLPSDLLSRDKSFKKELNKLQSELYHLQDSVEFQQEQRQKVFDLQNAYDIFQDSLNRNYPMLDEQLYARESPSIKTLRQKLLNEESMLVEYFIDDSILYSFSLTLDTLIVHKDTLNLGFQKLVVDFNELVRTLQNDKFKEFTYTSYELYSILLESILEHESSEKKVLYIIPDGILNYISFDALISDMPDNPGNNRYDLLDYLVKSHEINYNYSSYLYQFKSQFDSRELSGFAPSFDSDGSNPEGLAALPFSSEEVLIIDDIFEGDMFVDTSATLERYRESIDTYNIAHLATHAICNDSIPMQSKIYFHDDELSTYEIYNMPNSLDLVVLSACNSGTGKLREGEGIMSLSRAFLASGCSSIITSLWNVNDRVSLDLMTHFYSALSEGNTVGQSLRKSKLSYLNNSSSIIDAHPYYWSGFVLVGDNASFNIQSRWIFYLIALLFILAFVSMVFKFKKQQ